VIDPATGDVVVLDVGCDEIASLVATATTAVFVGSSFTSEPAVRAALIGRSSTPPVDLLRPPRDLGLPSGYLSVGEPITFGTGPDVACGEGAVAHAIFYPATNPDVVASADDLPPLLVMIHGGPTSSARAELRLAVQFWTSRGI